MPRYDPAQILRVSIDFEAGGNALVRMTAPVGSSSVSGATGSASVSETQLPVSVTATLQYDERRVATAAQVSPGRPIAVRYYDRAEATIKVDKGGLAPRLAESRRLIVVEHATTRPKLYCPTSPVPRDELDLIDIVGNSTYLDRLLPNRPVAKDESWPADRAALAAFLTFDTVTVCEVQSVLEEYNASFAKVRLAGVIHGTVDGTPTEQEVRAVYLFDRKQQRIARINIAAREKRSIGGASPGLDATARLQIKIEPLAGPTHLSDDALNLALRAKHPAADLLYEAPTLGFRAIHDRGWFVASQGREMVTFRRVDQGDVIAQCTISALAPKSAGRQTSLEQFQRDIVLSLGKNFGEMVSARQWTSARGHYCYGVVARGLVEEMPIEWRYYLVAQETGHRVSVAVTIEKPMLERLGKADLVLVEAIELFQPVLPAQAKASTPAVK
jgi:hypothetical protein